MSIATEATDTETRIHGMDTEGASVPRAQRLESDLIAERLIKERGALEWVAGRYWYLRTMCFRVTRRYDLIDDLMGEVIDRAPRLFETHDENKGELDGYVLGSLREYLHKFVRRAMKRPGYAKQREHLYEDIAPSDSYCLPKRVKDQDAHPNAPALDRIVDEIIGDRFKVRTAERRAELTQVALSVLNKNELCFVLSRYWRGENYETIGATVGTSASNVKRLCYIAFDKMRAAIATHDRDLSPLERLTLDALKQYKIESRPTISSTPKG